MARYRKIAAMTLPGVTPGGADMPEPKFERMRPGALIVDEGYQRNLSERSVRLIRKMILRWDWRTFMPPVVVKLSDGVHVIDGQHTAIAAASHPRIKDIPVMVVKADHVRERAQAFLGRNRDRITVTPNQLHYAAVAAGDEDATTIDQVCARAGIRILKNPPQAAYFKPGETLAIRTISRLIDRRGAMGARKILQVITAAKVGPVSQTFIRAVDEILSNPSLSDGAVDAGDLTTILRRDGRELETAAKIYAASHGVQIWQGMTAVLLQRCKRGRRRAA